MGTVAEEIETVWEGARGWTHKTAVVRAKGKGQMDWGKKERRSEGNSSAVLSGSCPSVPGRGENLGRKGHSGAELPTGDSAARLR